MSFSGPVARRWVTVFLHCVTQLRAGAARFAAGVCAAGRLS
jgi:hypothetical protein